MDIEPGPGRGPAGRVLVVGAGPVGLVCALLLRHHGAEVEILDRNPEAVSQSRATDLHPATLERLAPYGFTADLLDIGQVVTAAVVHCRGTVAGTIPMGRTSSPFPFALTVPQCTTEGLLQDRLSDLGTKVERGVELTRIEERPGHVEVEVALVDPHSVVIDSRVRGPGRRRPAAHGTVRRYDWVIACDGAGSTVRQSLDIGFPGRTTSEVSAIADVELDLPFRRDEIHLFLARRGGVHVLPMPIPGYVRLMLDRWSGPAGVSPDPIDLVQVASERLGLADLRPSGVRWTSSFVVHRRLAERFRRGRVLLAGDAAHVCPPVGGQGLNTGIADATALVPALVSVMAGHVDQSVLDTVTARRRRSASRTGRAAWTAACVSTLRWSPAATVRDVMAPLGLSVVRRPITRWLAGALD